MNVLAGLVVRKPREGLEQVDDISLKDQLLRNYNSSNFPEMWTRMPGPQYIAKSGQEIQQRNEGQEPISMRYESSASPMSVRYELSSSTHNINSENQDKSLPSTSSPENSRINEPGSSSEASLHSKDGRFENSVISIWRTSRTETSDGRKKTIPTPERNYTQSHVRFAELEANEIRAPVASTLPAHHNFYDTDDDSDFEDEQLVTLLETVLSNAFDAAIEKFQKRMYRHSLEILANVLDPWERAKADNPGLAKEVLEIRMGQLQGLCYLHLSDWRKAEMSYIELQKHSSSDQEKLSYLVIVAWINRNMGRPENTYKVCKKAFKQPGVVSVQAESAVKIFQLLVEALTALDRKLEADSYELLIKGKKKWDMNTIPPEAGFGLLFDDEEPSSEIADHSNGSSIQKPQVELASISMRLKRSDVATKSTKEELSVSKCGEEDDVSVPQSVQQLVPPKYEYSPIETLPDASFDRYLGLEVHFIETLKSAIKNRDAMQSKQLISNIAHIRHLQNPFNEFCIIHLATAAGMLDIVQHIIEKYPPESISPINNIMPLHIAAYHGNAGIIKAMLEFDYSYKSRTCQDSCPDRKTPLHFAIIRDHFDAAKELLEAGADPNVDLDRDHWSKRCRRETLCLHDAIRRGNQKMFRLLVASGANINLSEEQGKESESIEKREEDPVVTKTGVDPEMSLYNEEMLSPFMDLDTKLSSYVNRSHGTISAIKLAATYGQVDILNDILELDIDQIYCTREDCRWIGEVLDSGNMEVFDRYLEVMLAHLPPQQMSRILFLCDAMGIAAKKGHTGMVQRLSEIQIRNTYQPTALVPEHLHENSPTDLYIRANLSSALNFAIEHNRKQTLQLLLKRPGIAITDMKPNLLPKFIEFLIDNPTSLDRESPAYDDLRAIVKWRDPDSGQQNALHKAAVQGHCKIIKTLVELGCHPGYADSTGRRAIHLAIENLHHEAVSVLIGLGGHLTPLLSDEVGIKPLHTAVLTNDISMVKLVAESFQGKYIDVRDYGGETPLMLAGGKQSHIGSYLVLMGANIEAKGWDW